MKVTNVFTPNMKITFSLSYVSMQTTYSFFKSNIQAVNDVKSPLCNNFDMKDLGEASVILGIQITRSEKITSLDKSHDV